MAASMLRRSRWAPALRGRKPSKKKRSMGSPEATRAQTTADGPGITSTGRPASSATSTRRWPGSLTPGMPASETKAMCAPPAIRSSMPGMREARTFSSARSSGVRIPKWASSLPVTRVSSHSTASASRSVSTTRDDASERLPIGVPTMESRPTISVLPCAISRASVARRWQVRHARPSR